MPTYEFGDFINETHRWLSTDQPCELFNLRGKICPQDGCKLYEMAYYAKGDILETGTFFGLSSLVLATATKDSFNANLKNHRGESSQKKKMIHTIEKAASASKTAEGNFKKHKVSGFIRPFVGDGTEVMKRFVQEKRKFGFAFIDHNHSYQPTKEACELLPELLIKNSFVLFHDFTHLGNKQPDNRRCKVWQAVMENLDKERFEFYGIYGVAALYLFKG